MRGDAPDSAEKYCEQMGQDFGKKVMDERQSGTPKSKVTTIVGQFEKKKVRQITYAIVDKAYKIEQFDKASKREEAIEAFAARAKILCLLVLAEEEEK